MKIVKHLSTTTLRTWQLRLSLLRGCARAVTRDLRYAVEDELLSRDLPALADASGAFLCIAPRGVQ
mgnify:CR=1 FL=1